AQHEYAYDDGIANITVGPPPSFSVYGDVAVLWGNYFYAEPGADILTEIHFGLGSLSAGGAVTIHIFDDADNDGDPRNASPVYSFATTGEELGFGFNVVSIDPTQVSGGFFVAIEHTAVYDPAENSFTNPARLDPSVPGTYSWLFYDSPGEMPYDNLAGAGFGVQMVSGVFVPIPGAWAIRAVAVPAPGAAALLGVAGLAGVRRRR